MSETLHVGRIPFLVCAPFFHQSLNGWPGADFSDGPPAWQNAQMRAGHVDLSPTSSLEYALRPHDYVLLPGLCTAGRLEIRSVRLFSRKPWEALAHEPVRLSAASATSNALFRILSHQAYGVRPRLLPPLAPRPPAHAEPHAAPNAAGSVAEDIAGLIAIGDEALHFARRADWPYSYDLAVEWLRWKNLPFAFGLWLVRRAAAEAASVGQGRVKRLADYAEHVQASVAVFRKDPQTALAHWLKAYPNSLPLGDILDFYSSADYALTEAHVESLQLFFGLARTEGLIETVPELRFFAAP